MGYWSATYLLSNGENPYNIDLMQSVQQVQVRSNLGVTIMAWNPPSLFVFLLPLAWMSFTTAKFIWLVGNIVTVLTATLILTGIYMADSPPKVKLVFLSIAIGFPAVIAGLYMGQVTFLVFWGLVASMALIRKEQWFWAGTVLILTTVKPHLAILSVMYLLLYMAKQRKYCGWAGLIVSGIFCVTILLILRPDLIYNLGGETAVAQVSWATATIGGLLSHLGLSETSRYLILLFLPLPFILIRYSHKISMELSIALLTLITVPTTFFGWSYDQAILLIPIAQVFGWLVHLKPKYKMLVSMCIGSGIAISYYQRLLIINDVYYVWIPLFWWLIFAIVWREFSLMDKKHV